MSAIRRKHEPSLARTSTSGGVISPVSTNGCFAIIARMSDCGEPPFPKNAGAAFSPLWPVLRMSRVRMPPARVQLTRMRSWGQLGAALWLYSIRACVTRGSNRCSSWAGSPL